MFVIRKPQIAVFGEIARRQFEEHLAALLEADFPSAYDRLGAAGTRDVVMESIASGAANGVVTESGVAALAGLMMQYGTSFERSPDRDWALETLRHPRLPEQLKIRLLLERMAARSRGRVVVEVKD